MARSFPAELVRMVMLHLKVDLYTNSSRTLLHALRVCKLWCEIGYQVLYADISVKEYELGRLAKRWPTGNTLIRSLSIRISCQYFGQQHRGFWNPHAAPVVDRYLDHVMRGIQSIAGIVQGMAQLESFSLVVPTIAPQNMIFAAVYNAVPHILRALPDSLRHLELDVVGNNTISLCSPPLPHFCPLLRERLPSLTNLRLRLPRLCPELFQRGDLEHPDDPQSPPKDGRLQSTVLVNALSVDIPSHNGYSAYGMVGNDGELKDVLQGLARAAQSAIADGTCQKPQRLSIFTQVQEMGYKDCAINELMVVPRVITLRSPFRCNQLHDRTFLRYLESDGSQGEAWGRWIGLMDVIEGRVWTKTVEGYRLPSVYLKQNPRLDVSMVKREFLPHKQVSTHARGGLFDKEKAEGRHLLRAQELPGWQLAGVARDLTRKEIQMALEAGNPDPQPGENHPDIYVELYGLDPEDEDILQMHFH